MSKHRYHINVFWSQRDESWVADVPDLKSCAAFGDTPEEAISEAQIATAAWLASATDGGLPIPERAIGLQFTLQRSRPNHFPTRQRPATPCARRIDSRALSHRQDGRRAR